MTYLRALILIIAATLLLEVAFAQETRLTCYGLILAIDHDAMKVSHVHFFGDRPSYRTYRAWMAGDQQLSWRDGDGNRYTLNLAT